MFALLAMSLAHGGEIVDPDVFVQLLADDRKSRMGAYREIERNWDPRYEAMVLETLRFVRDSDLSFRLITTLENHSAQRFGGDKDAWWEWLWATPEDLHPDYLAFKRQLYTEIDPRFHRYFRENPRTIRLDEVRWGGVKQDGIPPLREPVMIDASGAGYLQETDVVFGVAVEDDIRAYPKRILAWHEMFIDTLGGMPMAGVYCTLCGTVILYETEVDGTNHQIGTSGFLYRSNKLMYDQQTQSLWSTLEGRPVVGALVGKGIELRRRSVVTTTWGEWRRRHPDTKVLSLETGYDRDYDEGVAYRSYFATDELMFTVPKRDPRLKNKAEVLALRANGVELAISAAWLRKRPVYRDRVGEVSVVVLTDKSGANRVYDDQGVVFSGYDGDVSVTSEDGRTWVLTESALISGADSISRFPANRSFWFAWYSAFPETRLVW